MIPEVSGDGYPALLVRFTFHRAGKKQADKSSGIRLGGGESLHFFLNYLPFGKGVHKQRVFQPAGENKLLPQTVPEFRRNNHATLFVQGMLVLPHKQQTVTSVSPFHSTSLHLPPRTIHNAPFFMICQGVFFIFPLAGRKKIKTPGTGFLFFLILNLIFFRIFFHLLLFLIEPTTRPESAHPRHWVKTGI